MEIYKATTKDTETSMGLRSGTSGEINVLDGKEWYGVHTLGGGDG